ncbi:MAG: hypothetical protein M4579_004126 [Chaenotheca gracillima]|nr:MAG: hypothetical protein M4579_004126 [Chaenotheca gracillima]
MPFFKDLRDLRRRSKSSIRTDQSSSDSTTTDNNLPTAKSSSTLSSFYKSTTPPSSLQPSQSSSNLYPGNGPSPNGSQRPTLQTSPNNRYSISGLSSPSTNGNGNAAPPVSTSPYAPRVLSVSENSWVHQKILLLYGQIGDPSAAQLDGNLQISYPQDSFPTINWPVCDSHFKALVHLVPGPNRLRLDFTSPKLSSTNNGSSTHTTTININYLPLVSAPPLQLAILVAKDSPMTFDAVPERIQREGNGLDMAIRKFRMSAYLWQAFTGEQMYRNRFGRRCFRFEEEWQTGTLTQRDRFQGQMRNEAKIHIIRSDKTVQAIQDLNIAQQYNRATKKGDLYSFTMDAVRKYFQPMGNQTQYVSVLILDSHWDKKIGTVRGHAALGGGAGNIQLAIFGSHALQSYPSCLEEVVPAFTDCTRTDTEYVANDCNESGSNWEAANIGIGAHLHETGHLLGCPHQENGVMLRDYVRLNRTFTVREPYSTRTKSQGQRLCLPKDECTWHRLDCLRFRYHPCFRLPSDPAPGNDESVQVWAIGNGSAMVTCGAGIGFIELRGEDGPCKSHLEYGDGMVASSLPRQVLLTEQDLRAKLPEGPKSKRMKVEIFSAGQGKHTIEDFGQLVAKSSSVKLPNGQVGFRGSKLGSSNMQGTQPYEVILHSAMEQTKLLVTIKVYHGSAVDGLEFIYEDFTTQLFGKKGGKAGGSEFNLDTRRGEILMGFYVRAGQWIDGLEILTSLGRRSGVFGKADGGSGYTLIPPRGYSIAGVSGTSGPWLDGFSVIITR